MTKDEIQALAYKAKIKPMLQDGRWGFTNMEVFVDLLLKEEREACAKLCDELHRNPSAEPDECAAAELRRLYQFAEDQIGRATAAEASLQMTRATHALKIAAVEAQRDALLEALKELTGHTNKRFTGGVWDRARAAIKAVGGEKT